MDRIPPLRCSHLAEVPVIELKVGVLSRAAPAHVCRYVPRGLVHREVMIEGQGRTDIYRSRDPERGPGETGGHRAVDNAGMGDVHRRGILADHCDHGGTGYIPVGKGDVPRELEDRDITVFLCLPVFWFHRPAVEKIVGLPGGQVDEDGFVDMGSCVIRPVIHEIRQALVGILHPVPGGRLVEQQGAGIQAVVALRVEDAGGNRGQVCVVVPVARLVVADRCDAVHGHDPAPGTSIESLVSRWLPAKGIGVLRRIWGIGARRQVRPGVPVYVGNAFEYDGPEWSKCQQEQYYRA